MAVANRYVAELGNEKETCSGKVRASRAVPRIVYPGAGTKGYHLDGHL